METARIDESSSRSSSSADTARNISQYIDECTGTDDSASSPSIMVVTQSVQVFGRKKTATAVAYCKKGRGLIKVNGRPLEHIQPEILRIKLQEPLLILGKERYQDVDIRVRVNGGGHVAQLVFLDGSCNSVVY
ncbi:unnamed protein product [Brugia pahangi]|uniref:Small ribosomal subunit protein uS9 n=1 Tax=Brugia pahangi TaxID=6280 RepID=A0A0N4T8B0_BRUPA|nr:unnamed protein product [Brugia pahangi]